MDWWTSVLPNTPHFGLKVENLVCGKPQPENQLTFNNKAIEANFPRPRPLMAAIQFPSAGFRDLLNCSRHGAFC